MLYSSLLFQINHIFAVFLKLQTAVGGHTLPAFLFKGRGESLGLFSCAFLRPCGRDFKGGRPRLELLSVRTTATVNADRVGDQLAGLIPALLDVSHYVHLLFQMVALIIQMRQND